MLSENINTLLLGVWVIAVCVAATAAGMTSVSNWFVVACVAIVPLVVVRTVWRGRERTMSERIHDARR